jgi:hypothetical protein
LGVIVPRLGVLLITVRNEYHITCSLRTLLLQSQNAFQ